MNKIAKICDQVSEPVINEGPPLQPVNKLQDLLQAGRH